MIKGKELLGILLKTLVLTILGHPNIQGVRKVTIQSYKLLYSFIVLFALIITVFSDVTHVFSEIFINIKVLFLLLQINIVIQYLTVLLIYYRVSV